MDLCLNEAQCMYAALYEGNTCSRYNDGAGACEQFGVANHDLFKKVVEPCMPPSPSVPPLAPSPPCSPPCSPPPPTRPPPPSPLPDPPPPPLPPPVPHAEREVAILYHGSYARNDGKCADFFKVAYNHRTMVVDPLREAGLDVVTVFHTFRSGCRARDRALVCFLQPIAHRFADWYRAMAPHIVPALATACVCTISHCHVCTVLCGTGTAHASSTATSRLSTCSRPRGVGWSANSHSHSARNTH